VTAASAQCRPTDRSPGDTPSRYQDQLPKAAEQPEDAVEQRRAAERRARLRARLPAAGALAGIAIGGLLAVLSLPSAADGVWAATVALMLVPLSTSVVRALASGRMGVDLIALMAMAGALALGEYLAGAVIALMLAGGNALEAFAAGHARRELTALVERAPRTARRRRDDGWEEVPVEEIEVGDVLLVRQGDVLPTDGRVLSEHAVIDESSLTGESLPVTYPSGGVVAGGTANAGGAFELIAMRLASDSVYAALVRLVRDAEARRAPFVRMADRYAALFLPLTIAIAAGAWALSGVPSRALAVLVVATPCPLILAAPIAFVAGLSRAAREGVIVKGGVAIEALGRARTVLLDKTGTLTLGVPAVEQVEPLDGVTREDLLRLAASLDQLSSHVLARAIVGQAGAEGLALAEPTHVRESPGEGIEGAVEGKRVAVGGLAWLRACGVRLPGGSASADAPPGNAVVFVGLDGRFAGRLAMGDHVRADAPQLIARLHAMGVSDVALLSGDREEVARPVAEGLGIDRVYSERSPEDKLAIVRGIRDDPGRAPVVMVGDGVNDAPALATADVGIAMAGSGATVSSQTADVVITVDRIDRVADAIQIGRRTISIATQSVVGGIALSSCGMLLAALGWLAPIEGALAQEAIDVAVILNALRALRPGR
jgi:heavy metal translocating P-type ATPase